MSGQRQHHQVRLLLWPAGCECRNEISGRRSVRHSHKLVSGEGSGGNLDFNLLLPSTGSSIKGSPRASPFAQNKSPGVDSLKSGRTGFEVGLGLRSEENPGVCQRRLLPGMLSRHRHESGGDSVEFRNGLRFATSLCTTFWSSLDRLQPASCRS